MGAFFYALVFLPGWVTLAVAAGMLTTISDVVYRADGTPARGTVVVTWPAFSAADGRAIAAGSLSVPIAGSGQLTVGLVPNSGGTPAGTYYKVVYKLDEAVSSREIVDEDKFRDGLSKIIDGTVSCLNASSWGKK